MEVTIYTKTGSTLRFRDVTNLTSVVGELNFDYVSTSRGVKCKARFVVQNLAGYSFDQV